MNKVLLCGLLALLFSCSSTYPNKVVIGEILPSFTGKTLSREKVRFPDLIKGKPSLLLIGYKQNSQFDIDRWLIGLEMMNITFPVFEIPVLAPWFPTFLQKKIDSGMRSGIPNQLWKQVVTVYEDANVVKKFVGNENPLNARVLLIDKDGRILIQFDNGFSVPSLKKIKSFQKK